MPKYGSPSIVVTLDDSAGTPRIITQFCLTMGALKITNVAQVSTPFGTGWEQQLVTGIRKGTPIGLTGLYDDTALVGTGAVLQVTDADAVIGFTRSLTVAIGSGHVYTAEIILSDSSVVPKPNALVSVSPWRTAIRAGLMPSS